MQTHGYDWTTDFFVKKEKQYQHLVSEVFQVIVWEKLKDMKMLRYPAFVLKLIMLLP